jgi:polysaccharide deacetylase 2 family uncharacterized protein YibQ
MVKTRGRKRKGPSIILTILILSAVAALSRSLLKHDEPGGLTTPEPGKQSDTPVMKPNREPAGPPEETKPSPRPERARIAVIIDDVGYPSTTLEGYLDFKGKLTFSILPFQSDTAHAARLLHQKGFEIMVHIPMEPLDFPVQDPGEPALFLFDSRNQVEDKLDRMIGTIPHVKGANNHMGSRATQDPELMLWTLSFLQKRGLYFVDSLTSPQSRAYEISRAVDIPSTKRDVFLDNHRDYPSIKGQFEEVKGIARSRGSAVAIGHLQSENLLRVLNEELSRLEEQGLELVFASEVAAK